MSGSGFNGSRKALQNESDISEEIESQRGTLGAPVLHVAVVTDVLVNPKILSSEEISDLESSTSTPELVKRAPRNSIVGRIITRNQDHFDSSPRILFPMGIYDAEPVKPGEHVFVFFVDYEVNDQIGYWWRRVPQPMDTDDLNFTHADRKYQHNDGLSTRDKFIGETPPPPDFVNGGDDEEQHTLAGGDSYKKIDKEAKSNKMIIKEAVPRFTKRPGDKVVQGSNGSRIVFGMDRTGAATDPPKKNSPTIDIVVGYGQEGTPTAPVSIENSRGDKETDKTPEKRKKKENVREGDPDFINDKTRVYVSAKTDIDLNMKMLIPGVPPTIGNKPALGVITDQFRVDARQDLKLRSGESAIVMDSSGNIRLVGGRSISLGNANASLGVARLTDKASADPGMLAWISQVTTALTQIAVYVNALVPGSVVPPTGPPADFGSISSASKKVRSE